MQKKIVLIGLGQMGINYLKNLLSIYAEGEIVGVDIDPAKIEAAREKWPAIDYRQALEGDIPKVAIVCTNTPSHHKVIIKLTELGVTHVFCEKPLGMNIEAVNQIRDAIVKTGTQVYAAFLINFSPVLKDLAGLMKEEDLILTEGHVVWGKNRFGNNRPTPGDLEDESVHGVGVLHMLAGINQSVKAISVSGRLTFPAYVNEATQAKARELDPTFPASDAVNASSMIIEQVVTDRSECLTFSVHSSYIMGIQRREVGVLLCDANDPRSPRYYAYMQFDIQVDGKITDRLTLTEITSNTISVTEKACNKVMEETRAFLSAAAGEELDPRSTNFAEALMAVRFSDAVLRSHMNGGEVVDVYSHLDVVSTSAMAA